MYKHSMCPACGDTYDDRDLQMHPCPMDNERYSHSALLAFWGFVGALCVIFWVAVYQMVTK
jgi:hypothetical protein